MKLPGALQRPSLARRLVLLAVGWSVAALVASAVLLAFLFQQAAVRRLDASLAQLSTLLLTGTTIEDGQPRAPPLTDPLASRAYSGRYWEIATPQAELCVSAGSARRCRISKP